MGVRKSSARKSKPKAKGKSKPLPATKAAKVLVADAESLPNTNKNVEQAKELMELFYSSVRASEYDANAASTLSASMRKQGKDLSAKGNKAIPPP